MAFIYKQCLINAILCSLLLSSYKPIHKVSYVTHRKNHNLLYSVYILRTL